MPLNDDRRSVESKTVCGSNITVTTLM